MSSGESQSLLRADEGESSSYGTQRRSIDNGESGHGDPNAANDVPTYSMIWKLTGLYLGVLLAALDSTLVGTLVGPISASFGNQRLLSWLASSYFIATCLSQPVVGKITDVFGRKNILIISSIIFSLGNIICAVTRSDWGLIIGRVVAGVGGGTMGPIATIVLSDIIPLRQRGVWQGTANICFGIGSGLGGPVGGFVTQGLGWRWAFVLQVPVTAVSLVLITWKLPETCPSLGKESRLQRLKRIDWIGSLTLIVCLVTLLFALNAGGSSLPWTHPAVIACLCAAALLLVAFTWVEKSFASEPILPLPLFTDRTVIAACLTNWFCSMARFGLLFYAPLLFQLQGYSIAEAGLRFVPEAFATSIASIGAGFIMRATGRYHEQGIVVVALQALGVGLMASISLQTPAWPPYVYLFVGGLGYSGMITTMLVATIASIDQAWQAVATSTSYLFRSTGSVIGITVASVVFQSALKANLSDLFRDRGDAARLIDSIQSDLHNIDHLPDGLKTGAQESYLRALQVVFLVLTGLSATGLLSAAAMKHHRLHKTLARTDSD